MLFLRYGVVSIMDLWRANKKKITISIPIDKDALGYAEAMIYAEALKQCEWNMTRVARVLGVEKRTVRRKIDLYGIIPPDGEEIKEGKRIKPWIE